MMKNAQHRKSTAFPSSVLDTYLSAGIRSKSKRKPQHVQLSAPRERTPSSVSDSRASTDDLALTVREAKRSAGPPPDFLGDVSSADMALFGVNTVCFGFRPPFPFSPRVC